MPFFVAFFFEKTFDTFFGTYVFLNCKYCCAFFAYFQFKKKMLKIQFANSSKRITTSHEDTLDTRKEDSLKTLIWFFIPMSVYYFAIVGGESTYYANIFSYATCALSLPPKGLGGLLRICWICTEFKMTISPPTYHLRTWFLVRSKTLVIGGV